MLASSAGAGPLDDLRQELAGLRAQVDRAEARQRAQLATAVIAPAADNPQLGRFRRSYTIPGTKTSLSIRGRVKLDALYTTEAGLGDTFGLFTAPAPGTAAEFTNGQTRLHVRETRFTIRTLTPTDVGRLETYVEGDFFGFLGTETNTNSNNFRLRQAYATIGNFLFGQTWGNMVIPGSYANTVDFGGTQGVWFSRSAQIRYAHVFNENWIGEISVENPSSVFPASLASPFSPGLFKVDLSAGVGSNEDRIPDFVAKLTYNADWGSLSLAGLFGVHDINTISVPAPGSSMVLKDLLPMWALQLGGRVQTWGRDSIGFSISYNEGAGRTLTAHIGPTTYVNIDAAGEPSLKTISSMGLAIHYEHWWRPDLYSVIAYGTTQIDYPSDRIPAGILRPTFIGLPERKDSFHVNLQWVPVAGVGVGIEYILGYVDFKIGDALANAGVDDDNTFQRVVFSVGFSF